jgi:hypothetical protein
VPPPFKPTGAAPRSDLRVARRFRYEVEQEAAQALDEAVLLRRAEAETAAAAEEGPAGGELPF